MTLEEIRREIQDRDAAISRLSMLNFALQDQVRDLHGENANLRVQLKDLREDGKVQGLKVASQGEIGD